MVQVVDTVKVVETVKVVDTVTVVQKTEKPARTAKCVTHSVPHTAIKCDDVLATDCANKQFDQHLCTDYVEPYLTFTRILRDGNSQESCHGGN